MKAGILVLLCGVVLHAQAPTPASVPTVNLTCDTAGCRAVPVAPADLPTILQALNTTVAQVLATDQKILVVQTDIDTQVKSASVSVGSVVSWLGKYVAPAVLAYLAGKKLI